MNQPVKQSVKPSFVLKQKDNSRLLLVAGITAALVGGGITAAWFLVVKPALESALPTGAKVIPPNALMTLSVGTDPRQWKQLRALGTSQSRTILDQELVKWRDRLLTANGLNYTQDVQPWVGSEVTLALLPATTSAPNLAQQPSRLAPPANAVAAILPIANPTAALQALQKSHSQSGASWQERTYQGMQIRERRSEPNQTLATTVLDSRWLVITTHPKAVEQVIDAFKSGVSVTSTPGYLQAWNAIQAEKPFAKIFVNVPVAAAELAKGTATPLTPEQLAQRQQNQGLAAVVSLTETGLDFKGLSWLRPDSTRKLVVQNHARLMPSLLPAQTYMLLSGSNLKQLWQDYGQGADTNPMAPFPPQQLRDGLQTITGLDFERDILSWMGGEYALAFIPASKTAGRDTGTGVALLAQASDRRAAEQLFQKLDQVVSSRYKFQVKQDQIQNQPVVTWADSSGRVIAAHGWLSHDVAFLSAGAAIADTLVPQPQTALANADRFTKALPTGLTANSGHFFLDVDQTINHPMPLLPFLPTQNPFIEATRTIGVTAAVRDERSTRFDVRVQLKQSGAVQPLPAPGTSAATPTDPPPSTAASPSSN